MTGKDGKYFWRGIKHDISPCCIMFFEKEWQSIRKSNREYGEKMHKMTNNQGVILCPECLTRQIAELSLQSVSM
jgi:hypothetical protein